MERPAAELGRVGYRMPAPDGHGLGGRRRKYDDVRSRMMRWIPIRIVFVLVAALLGPAGVSAQDGECQFVQGFATLHALLPTVVGACLENEQHNPSNGDALQRTTGGLLVWRKADNWTAFTDGYATWVNGPFGLQQRLNTQRFAWEANPEHLAIVPQPTPGDRCHTAGLDLSLDRIDAGAGNRVGMFILHNTSGVACVLAGYPGAQLRTATGDELPTDTVWGGGYFSRQPRPQPVSVPADGYAEFDVHWEVIPVADETACPTASRLAVTPPDEYSPLLVDVQIQACGSGHLDISAIHPPSGVLATRMVGDRGLGRDDPPPIPTHCRACTMLHRSLPTR
jgi:Protein of unknown function (DUF4232)